MQRTRATCHTCICMSATWQTCMNLHDLFNRTLVLHLDDDEKLENLSKHHNFYRHHCGPPLPPPPPHPAAAASTAGHRCRYPTYTRVSLVRITSTCSLNFGVSTS
ncbi:hypothetical protein Hdeb2414_s0021g00578091 [Helianthus debilis subsp. tardiflorus]